MSLALVTFFAPVIKSCGVARILCYLNGIKLDNYLTFKNLTIKLLSSIFSVSASMPLGVEGPMIFIEFDEIYILLMKLEPL
ncbi:hypothetical protein A3Q56_04918 [Intoshia linei]|uniref:Uncharacterized protein n=1 Tax=Intoshia linei TaxID=1819745 RepID=A0A177B147_9BILA|nr:hypothetical protein A3Q56_04918 [Intoshia linei]